MKHFQLAIASIVDANTGYGLARGGDVRDTATQERYAREIRSRSVHALLGSLRDSIASLAATLREKSRQRRALAALSRLSDYYLEDIGLTRGDVTAVELGQISLESLNAERRVRLSNEPRNLSASASVEQSTSGASNEDSYREARRA